MNKREKFLLPDAISPNELNGLADMGCLAL